MFSLQKLVAIKFVLWDSYEHMGILTDFVFIFFHGWHTALTFQQVI